MKYKQLNAIKACAWELEWIDGKKGRKHNPDPVQRINIKLNILARYMVNGLINKGLECTILERCIDRTGPTPMAEVNIQLSLQNHKKALELIGSRESYQIGNNHYIVAETFGNIGARYILEFTPN